MTLPQRIAACICRHDSASSCYEARYPRPLDDTDVLEYDPYAECQCGCHDEIADERGDADEQEPSL